MDDFDETEKALFLKASKQEATEAQYELASLYIKKQDYLRAYFWLAVSSEHCEKSESSLHKIEEKVSLANAAMVHDAVALFKDKGKLINFFKRGV